MPGPPPRAAGIGYVGMAEIAYQWGELDAALRYLTEGIPLTRQFPYTQPLTTGLATLAWIREARGDAPRAWEAMCEAERAAPDPAVTGLLNPMPPKRIWLLLAQGEITRAAHWTHERAVGAEEVQRPRRK